MRHTIPLLTLAIVSFAPLASAQPKFPAVLGGHAILPAMTFVPAPADAPPELQISGRYATPSPMRVDVPESATGISALSDKTAPRPTGIKLPFKGQPVQGLSGIKNLKDGTYITLTDNGFGSKANSPDAMLMFHVVKPDWKTGAIERVSTTFLHDPDRKVPFRIVNENTPKRYLTGSDFDIESIQPIAGNLWFGDEFGPFLIKTDRSGKVSPAFEIQNHNQLLENYPGTIGVKNGYTTGARNTFIGAVTRGGRTLLITQMGATLTPSWQRQAALLDWAFANAGQLRPVGTLVAPGAAQPPELGGTPAPTTAGTPVPSATTNEPIPTATTSLPPVVAAEGIGPGGNPAPWLLASAGTAARNPITWLVVVVVGLVVVLGLRRWVRRAGPED